MDLPYSLKNYEYFNEGPLNVELLHKLEFKPTEKNYADGHYKYFSYLYKLGRINIEQGIVKLVAPHSEMQKLQAINFQEALRTSISADVQELWSMYSDVPTSGVFVTVDKKEQMSLQKMFQSDSSRRIREVESLKHHMNLFWERLSHCGSTSAMQVRCGSYINEREVNFDKTVDISAALDMLQAIQSREDIHCPLLFMGSNGVFSSRYNDDIDLLTVNMMYFGRPKIYYVIPQSEFPKYVELMKKTFHSTASQRLENNCFIVPPKALDEAKIKYVTMAQNPGDIVYVFGKTIWFCINTGPSLEHIISCGHYLWGKSICDFSSFNIIYDGIRYRPDEIKLLESYVKAQELFWEKNREKRLKIKSRDNYLEKRREYDRKAKAKLTEEQKEEQLRRKSLNQLLRKRKNPHPAKKRGRPPLHSYSSHTNSRDESKIKDAENSSILDFEEFDENAANVEDGWVTDSDESMDEYRKLPGKSCV